MPTAPRMPSYRWIVAFVMAVVAGFIWWSANGQLKTGSGPVDQINELRLPVGNEINTTNSMQN